MKRFGAFLLLAAILAMITLAEADEYHFGLPGDIPIMGDWNGDGRTKIGVVRVINGELHWYLDWNGNGIWEGPEIDRRFECGIAGDTPIVGQWTMNGRDQIGVYRDGLWRVDIMGDGSCVDRMIIPPPLK